MVEETGDTWMTPITRYLESGLLPPDKNEARRLQLQASHYVLQDGVLYRRAYLLPLQRCVGPVQADYIIREMHYVWLVWKSHWVSGSNEENNALGVLLADSRQ